MLMTKGVVGAISGYQSIRKHITLTCGSLGCYLQHGLTGGASVSSRSLQATGPHKMDAEAAIL